MATENPRTKKAGKVTKDKPEKEIKSKPIKKTATGTRSRKVSATAKAAPAPTQTKAENTISREERIDMIRTAAYYLSQQRNHQGDFQLDDWVEAEREIDGLID